MAAPWEPFGDGAFETPNAISVGGKVPSKTLQKKTPEPLHSIVGKIEDAIDSALEALQRELDITSRCDFTPSNILKLAPMLGETATKSLGEYPTLRQVFRILMDYLWSFYPVSATRDSVVDSQLRSNEAKYWLLAKMNAIWIFHCSESLDDVLTGLLERIVHQIFWAFQDFPKFEVFEMIHDGNDSMIPKIRGVTKAGEHFDNTP